MAKQAIKNDAITARDEDFAQWYTDVCIKAELMDYSSIKGFIIYRPAGYSLWEQIQNYMDKSIREFVVFVMDNWLIEQHRRTAFEKLMQERDGFYFEEIDGSYSHKAGFEIDFQGIRLYQLSQVMKDLNML